MKIMLVPLAIDVDNISDDDRQSQSRDRQVSDFELSQGPTRFVLPSQPGPAASRPWRPRYL